MFWSNEAISLWFNMHSIKNKSEFLVFRPRSHVLCTQHTSLTHPESASSIAPFSHDSPSIMDSPDEANRFSVLMHTFLPDLVIAVKGQQKNPSQSLYKKKKKKKWVQEAVGMTTCAFCHLSVMQMVVFQSTFISLFSFYHAHFVFSFLPQMLLRKSSKESKIICYLVS